MKLKFTNTDIYPIIEFLLAMPLKNKDSRHRGRLVKRLKASYEELIEAEQALMAEYDLLDDKGELIDYSGVDPKIVHQFNADQQVLYTESTIIESGMFEFDFNEMPRILEEYDAELTGSDALRYDAILDAFDESFRDDGTE